MVYAKQKRPYVFFFRHDFAVVFVIVESSENKYEKTDGFSPSRRLANSHFAVEDPERERSELKFARISN